MTERTSLWDALEERWRTTPTDLGGWANRASQLRQLAEAADRVISCYEAIEFEKPVRDFDEALSAYERAKDSVRHGR